MIDTFLNEKALIKDEFEEFQNNLDENIKIFSEELFDGYGEDNEHALRCFFSFIESRKYLDRFLREVDLEKIFKLTPEVSIDDDGEISVEWFGEIGSRCSLTFGGDGLLYFASMNKGLSLNFKQFINRKSISIIENEIEKISENKLLWN